jgi:hypothetical protein
MALVLAELLDNAMELLCPVPGTACGPVVICRIFDDVDWKFVAAIDTCRLSWSNTT